jgi:hypothetical protein
MKHGRVLSFLIGVSIGLGIGVIGCRPSATPTPPSSTTAPALETSLATPGDAAQTVLSCLRTEHAARRQEDEQTVKRCEAQLRGLAARDVILRRFRELTRAPASDPDKLLATYVDSWDTVVAAYVDGLQFEHMQAPPGAADSDQTFVLVPAESRVGNAVIRVECIRAADKTWRVARLSFEPDRTGMRPATTSAP